MSPAWTPVRRSTVKVSAQPLGFRALLFIALHVPLALLMHYVSFVTAVHALGTAGVGLFWAGKDDRPDRVACLAAYITGAEVLWRMTNDQLFWELGKYSMIGIGALTMFRLNRRALFWSAAAFSLLLPSAVLTVANYPLAEARNQLSFNLSGPLSLCMAAGLFACVSLSRIQLQRLCLALVAPVTGIAAIAVFLISTNPNLQFSHQSNFALSGGFGPNQVSAALGLGALMAALFLFEPDTRWFLRAGLFAVMVWLAGQSALTFSRGGLFAALGGAVMATLLRVNEPRELVKPLAIGLLVLGIGYTVVWPRLDAFTGGNISQRFTETDTSLRADLGEADMQLWREHRIMGVGPGRSKLSHLDDIIAHTEFTRLLAEHGAFGVLYMALMAGFGVINAWRGSSGRERGLAAAFTMWALLFMLNSAMRLVAPSFMFGLAFCRIHALKSTRAQKVARVRATPRWTLVTSG
jgi:hypothetical protein